MRRSEIKNLIGLLNEIALITTTDLNGKITYSNKKFAEFSGYTPHSIVGVSHPIKASSFHSDSFYKDLWSTILSGNKWKGIIKYKANLSAIQWLETSIFPIQKDDKIEGFVVIQNTIKEKERKNSSKLALQEHQEILNQLLQEATNVIHLDDFFKTSIELIYKASFISDQQPIGIYQTNVKNKLILKWSKNFSSEGKRRCHIIDLGLCHCGTAAQHRKSVFSTRVDRRHDISYNEMADHSNYSIPIVYNKNLFGVLVVYLNPEHHYTEIEESFLKCITNIFAIVFNRAMRENDLTKAKDEANRANNAKSEFLSTMSHEIRTPLNAITGIGNLLQVKTDPIEQEKLVKTLLFSSKLLTSLVNDVLDFSKIERGKIEIEKIDFLLYDLLEELRSLWLFAANEKGLDIYLNISNSVPNVVKGDPVRLNQIIGNLINNAIKFTDKGYVTINVEAQLTSPHHSLIMFEVIDTGIGIERNKIDTIFNKFTQGSASTNRKYGGTGLGLNISKNLVKKMGGDLAVKSKYGEGSNFHFYLPFQVSEKKKIEFVGYDSSLGCNDLEGLKILVAEDNDINILIIQKFMDLWKIEMSLAKNGKEAVELVKGNQSFNLILMDIQMPEMNGFEASKQIRSMEDPEKNSIPILALTASVLQEDKQLIHQYGINDFVTKPFNPKTLYSKMRYYTNLAVSA